MYSLISRTEVKREKDRYIAGGDKNTILGMLVAVPSQLVPTHDGSLVLSEPTPVSPCTTHRRRRRARVFGGDGVGTGRSIVVFPVVNRSRCASESTLRIQLVVEASVNPSSTALHCIEWVKDECRFE